MFADLAASKVVELCRRSNPPTELLDIGCGKGDQAQFFLNHGFKVTGVDIGPCSLQHPNFRLVNAYFDTDPWEDQLFDVIWASHVLEHSLNPHLFLSKIACIIKEGGWIAISVPPLKHAVVGGHVNLFNAGVLMYRMILAGISCRHAMIKTYGYNISIIVHFKRNPHHDLRDAIKKLKYDNGDIQTLSQFFPLGYNFQGFNGDIKQLNWD